MFRNVNEKLSSTGSSLLKISSHFSLLVAGLALLGCSPGGVVAGTIGAAGTVVGAAVDVVLREDIQQGLIK